MTQSRAENRKRRRWLLMGVFLAGLLGVIAWVAWGNTALVTTELSVKSGKLPAAFDGFRIVQVSDLHNASFGEGNAELLERVEQAQPDCIALTGDLVDSRHTDVETALSFAREAAKIAPSYYVTGNHEARLEDWEQLLTGLEEAGVTILQNESILLDREGHSIVFSGVEDPSFHDDHPLHDTEGIWERNLESLSPEEGRYTILFSHRPEFLTSMKSWGSTWCLRAMPTVASFGCRVLAGSVPLARACSRSMTQACISRVGLPWRSAGGWGTACSPSG